MITSIVLLDRYKIVIDKFGKFVLDELKLSIRDIPFIRYRFNDFNDSDIDYIKGLMNKFVYSTHLVEVTASEGYVESIEMLSNAFKNLAIFVYIDIYDENASTLEFNEEQIKYINDLVLVSGSIDRVMLRDKTTTLHKQSGDALRRKVCKIAKFKESFVGFCQSPLSMIDGEACLTASMARELAANYSSNEDCPVPSSNHERKTSCNECCGCIRYEVVEHDLLAEVKVDSEGKPKKPKGENKDSKPKEKKPTKVIPKGAYIGFKF